ncbi:hypothetical protein [Saccharospirillum sp. MSK14-1]|uniref:hypothetical protein n=1 Tax=Saccharospirillum sp. MSK14-1 TaxID=1897632 RepID=UPI0011B247AD|nr:hypothetical protein [Saccharospirillum sp. MSK14-1]
MLLFSKYSGFILSVCLWLIASCSLSQEFSSVVDPCSNDNLVSELDSVTNDEIFFSILNGPLEWSEVEPLLVNINREEVSGNYAGGSESYLIKSEDKEDYFSYYYSSGNVFPLCLYIRSPDILAEVSRVANEYDVFSDRLNNKDISTLKVSTLEGGAVMGFVFESGQLSLLVYRASYID